MGEVFSGRVFRSGNSAALRLPKALGIPEGTEVRIVKEDAMTFRVEPVSQPRKKLDVDSFWGKCPGLVPPPREDFDERPSTIAARKARKGS